MNYKVFLAWQSQNRDTERYIKKELKRTKDELTEEGKNIELIFSPTQEETGSPDIKLSILEQIKNCDIFVGDLSFIDAEKCVSNGNVLYETGIADAFLGDERVIILCDENTTIEDIPFDINHKRISRINTQKGKSGLKYWIRDALEESDRQRYIKTYATKQYEDELIILFNHFYKYVNMTKIKYGDEITIPNIDDIEKTLLESTFPYFFLHTDFTTLIGELENKLLKLNQFSHKRIVWYVMNIITKLQEYQKYCRQTRYAFIVDSVSKMAQYNVYDAQNFFLKRSSDFTTDLKTVLFSDNSEIVIGESGTLVMDKRIYTKDDRSYRREYIPMDREAQQVIVSKMVSINKEMISVISALVSNILFSIKEYLDYCDFRLVLETEALITIEEK